MRRQTRSDENTKVRLHAAARQFQIASNNSTCNIRGMGL